VASLKQYWEENPQKPSGQGSFLDREDIQHLIEEALEGINKDGIPATLVAKWLMSEVPDIGRKFHTVRQGLLHRAKEIS